MSLYPKKQINAHPAKGGETKKKKKICIFEGSYEGETLLRQDFIDSLSFFYWCESHHIPGAPRKIRQLVYDFGNNRTQEHFESFKCPHKVYCNYCQTDGHITASCWKRKTSYAAAVSPSQRPTVDEGEEQLEIEEEQDEEDASVGKVMRSQIRRRWKTHRVRVSWI